MIELNDISSERKIKQELGEGYNWIKKIKLKGTGCSKIIYLDGIDFFESIQQSGQDLPFTSFELHPNGIIGRLNKGNSTKGVVLRKEELTHITFLSRKIRTRSQGAFETHYDAKISFNTKDNKQMNFYAPAAYYETVRDFFQKDWLKTYTRFRMDPSDPVESDNGKLHHVFPGVFLYGEDLQ